MIGDYREMEQEAGTLKKLTDSSARAYFNFVEKRQPGVHTLKGIQKLMDAETWMDELQAVQLGFADFSKKEDPEPMEQTARQYFAMSWNQFLNNMQNVPQSVRDRVPPQTEQTVEKRYNVFGENGSGSMHPYLPPIMEITK